MEKTNNWISDRIAKLLPESIRGHTLTELGDMVSVIYGGYARIQTQIKNGMSEEEALKDFEKQTVETQQSDYSSLQPRSRLENGLLSRSFGMFKSQDAQYFQRTMQDLMRYFSGEATEENIRNNTIMYHLLLPALMTAVTGVIGGLYGKRDKDWWEYAKDYSTAVLLSFLPMGLLQQSVALEITMNFDNLKNAITSLFNLEGVITGLPLQTYYNMFFKRKNKEEEKKKKK